MKKSWEKFVPQKITQLISRHLVPKTGYEAGTSIVRLLSKASNTSFSHHTGCHFPVCITTGNQERTRGQRLMELTDGCNSEGDSQELPG